MPAPLDWIIVSPSLTKDDANALLDTFKKFKIKSSQLSVCNICSAAVPHKMRIRYMECSSAACRDVSPYAPCRWRGKTQTCEMLDVISFSELNSHVTVALSSQKSRLTESMKTFARDLRRQGLKPARIRFAMRRRFDLDEETLPKLAVVQRFVHHFASTQLGCNDFVDEIQDRVSAAAFTGYEEEGAAFIFGDQLNDKGKPIDGIGSDADPFLLGISSKKLLRRMDRDASTFMLHIDATYKLNQLTYPVFVIGISDCMRSFHLVALVVSSQQQEPHYTAALSSLRRVYTRVTNKQLAVRYVMGDADTAQYNALQSVYGVDSRFMKLMCFYHVLAKMKEKIGAVSDDTRALVVRNIHGLHYTATENEYLNTKTAVMNSRSKMPALSNFKAYFDKQWLSSRHASWQCYLRPVGFATTNNPAEQFNRALKRDYTLRCKLKVGSLVDQLLDCCKNESMSSKEFHIVSLPTDTLKRRVKEMQRSSCIYKYSPDRGRIAFVLGGCSSEAHLPDHLVRVVSRLCRRTFDDDSKRSIEDIQVSAQMGVNAARMEIHGMPTYGWIVNTATRTCPCKSFFKFAHCIHLVFALSITGDINLNGRRALVYRGPNKRRRNGELTQGAGRPAHNRHALQYE